MIAYLEGELIRTGIDYIIINVGGVGYKVYIPASLSHKLPEVGNEVQVHTYNYVREDKISLYGFSSLEELETFEQLLSVSRIGPQVALNILATISSRDFKLAILNGEVATLKKVKGIGNKTAKRLILELQEKVELDNIEEDANFSQTEVDTKAEDAIKALVSLGYQQGQARKVVLKVAQRDEELDVQGIIKTALADLS
ncbi:Holliday junction branch migration protein RuvA [Natroniella sulfidigena]|uniref:Holliday junction branch migration protein RuvA n=1 Tax=Natroniella sulfidigena TaxID=723921 RepID=UPI00200B13A2|nr:Holliday junction branch migration protein RuvA [Natroniella sulfidigena]MCK8815962.1 Holliday junction branch migration protein RuvA [Natroniella sulfidigena]